MLYFNHFTRVFILNAFNFSTVLMYFCFVSVFTTLGTLSWMKRQYTNVYLFTKVNKYANSNRKK